MSRRKPGGRGRQKMATRRPWHQVGDSVWGLDRAGNSVFMFRCWAIGHRTKATDEDRENAALIVQAVNERERLVEALRGILEQCTSETIPVVIQPGIEPYSFRVARELLAEIEES